jgi:hypothetical protein
MLLERELAVELPYLFAQLDLNWLKFIASLPRPLPTHKAVLGNIAVHQYLAPTQDVELNLHALMLFANLLI